LTTYAPFNKPKYIITTLVEHGGHGGGTNGPIVADIYKWMFERGYFNDENNATQPPSLKTALDATANTTVKESTPPAKPKPVEQTKPVEKREERNVIHLSDPQ
jgi:hypothetical protein